MSGNRSTRSKTTQCVKVDVRKRTAHFPHFGFFYSPIVVELAEEVLNCVSLR